MLQMVICSVLWSIAGVLIKQIGCGPFLIAGVRSFFAAICTAVFIKVRHIPVRINARVLVGAFFAAATFLCFVSANTLTDAANAIVLQYTEPVFLLIISAIIYKERMRLADVTVSLFTLCGIALFFIDSLSGSKMLGNVVAIGAGLMMAFMYMILGKLGDEDRISAMLFGHLATALVGGTLYLLMPQEVTWKDFGFMAILGIFQLGIAYIFFCLAVGKCSAFACSIIGAIEPLLNPVWVMIFTGETPGAFALVGAVVVIAAVTLWSVYDARSQQKSAA